MSVANEGLPEEALEDVQAARAVLATCGKLTGPVFDAVARWFMHVDLPTPIPVLAMAPEQRVVLEAQVLDDMSQDMQQGGTASAQLWRELAGLHAARINEQWQAIRPVDAEELQARIADLQEFTGLPARDMASRAAQDATLRSMIACLGLTVEDLS